MFLATTADKRFWDKSDPLLFLGEWCKLYQDQEELKKITHETLPYHWDDRERFHVDVKEIESIFEEYLAHMARCFNEIHGEDHDIEYWRMIIGLWLRNLIDATYDRYLSIKSAQMSGKVTSTWIGDTTPRYPNSRPSYAFDEYNHYLFSIIIEFLRPFPFIKKDVPYSFRGVSTVVTTAPKSRLGRIWAEAKRQISKGPVTAFKQGKDIIFIEILPKIMGKISHKFVICGTIYIRPWHQILFQLSLGQFPYIYHGKKTNLPAARPQVDLRASLAHPTPKSEFYYVLNRIIPSELPMMYFENYKLMKEISLKMSPKPPKVILTAFSINYREPVEFWMAHCREKFGTKVLLTQHGGGYGSALNGSVEYHFAKTFYRYFTWGSTLDGNPKVKRMPSFRLYQLKHRFRNYNPQGQILVMATTMPRYKVFAESGVAGPHMLNWIEEQKRFLSSLDRATFKLITWRYFNNMWNEVERFRDAFPNLRFQHGLKKQLGQPSDFISQVLLSRLTVHTANETTYLETIASNVPTVVYFNLDLYEVRPSLRGLYAKLENVGIFHPRPEAAAAFINSIRENPSAWWYSEKTQAVRKEFCENLSYTADDVFKVWKKELKADL